MYTQPVKSRARVPERGRNRARMVDGTLIIVSLAMEAVTQINRKSLRAHKTGHHNVSRSNVRVSQESCTVPVSAPPVNKRESDSAQERPERHRVTTPTEGNR